MNKAVIITAGRLDIDDAKTAHGLLRTSERFTIAAVVAAKNAGQDAGTVLDGRARSIPVYASVEEAVQAHPDLRYCIVGVATPGGIFPESMLLVLQTAIQNRLHIINGLHDYLNDRPDFAALAAQYGVTLTDIRRPKGRKDLHFWTGDIYKVPCPIVAVLGMDCALGKRTTARFLVEAIRKAGKRAEMIYTGQTGWMQGGKYGFIFDSTLNDFISGELEHAIVSCYENEKPDFIFLEGQSALRNPSGPCGSEYLVSGNARQVVLVHSPKRVWFHNHEPWGAIPSVESEIALVAHYGSRVIALALNTEGCTREEAFAFQKEYEQRTGLPVMLPLEEGVDKLADLLMG
jgi:uncharacterized NAD-dependent epimerase/dehydratase family protein